MRVLVVEDFEVLARSIGTGLRREGMAVDVVLDGDDALEQLAVTRYDVVVLDRDLPGVHGDEVCRRIVAGGSGSRVLMLTAASTVAGAGGGPGPGRGRLPAQAVRLRRARRAGPRPGPALRARGTADAGQRRVTARSEPPGRVPRRAAARPQPEGVRGAGVPAGRRRGRVVSAEELLDRVWDEAADPFTTAVKTHDPPAAGQARRPAGHPHRPRGRLPDRRAVMRPPDSRG